MSIVVQGFSTQKRPGFFGQTIFGAGPITLASIPLVLLMVGLKSSAGSMTADLDVISVQTTDQVDTAAGVGSELARMAYTGLLYENVKMKLACPTAAGGAVAAVATITLTGSVTLSGQWSYRIGGVLVSGAIPSSGQSLTSVALAISNAINANSRLPVTATPSVGVVTLTHKCPGIRGNQLILFQDATLLPSGLTSTLGGGTAVTGGGVPFHNGSGTEDVTNLAAVLFPGRYHRVAVAQNDGTNLAIWRTQSDRKALADEGRMEHYVFASNGTLAAAATLSTTLNEERMSHAHLLNSETLPSEIAASYGALRAVTEQLQPNSSYDNVTLLGVVAQSQRADWAPTATIEAALGEGVTELQTTEDGNVTISRAITTHSLNGSNPDYGTLDVADSVVPDYVRDFDALDWSTSFQPKNPFVRPDPAPGEPEPPAQVATPTRWARELAVNGFALEAAKILTATTLNPPVAEYDTTGKRIISIHPAPRLAHQHQLGEVVTGLGAV